MKIVKHGTFIYCTGTLVVEGWEIDCEREDIPTSEQVNTLILAWLTAVIVQIPALNAEIDALKMINRCKGSPDA